MKTVFATLFITGNGHSMTTTFHTGMKPLEKAAVGAQKQRASENLQRTAKTVSLGLGTVTRHGKVNRMILAAMASSEEVVVQTTLPLVAATVFTMSIGMMRVRARSRAAMVEGEAVAQVQTVTENRVVMIPQQMT